MQGWFALLSACYAGYVRAQIPKLNFDLGKVAQQGFQRQQQHVGIQIPVKSPQGFNTNPSMNPNALSNAMMNPHALSNSMNEMNNLNNHVLPGDPNALPNLQNVAKSNMSPQYQGGFPAMDTSQGFPKWSPGFYDGGSQEGADSPPVKSRLEQIMRGKLSGYPDPFSDNGVDPVKRSIGSNGIMPQKIPDVKADQFGRVGRMESQQSCSARSGDSASNAAISSPPQPLDTVSIPSPSRLSVTNGMNVMGAPAPPETPRPHDPYLYLRDYFQRIVENSFSSSNFRGWFKDFVSKSGSTNMLDWECGEMIRLNYEARRAALGEILQTRSDFEQAIAHRDKKKKTLNLFWVPGFITQRITSVLSGVFSFVSSMFHLRPECYPRVFKDQMLLFLNDWDKLHHSGISQVYFWNFHYHSNSYIVDHPDSPADADIAYLSTMLSQAEVLIERDLHNSHEATQYFSEEIINTIAKEIPVQGSELETAKRISEKADLQIKRIAIEELEKYGDNIDSEGRFTNMEILYRNLFQKWYKDTGLLQEFLRYIARHGQVGTSVIDIGAGGGHYSKALNESGIVTAYGYDATVNLLPVEVDLESEMEGYTDGKVRYFDVSKPVPEAKGLTKMPKIMPRDFALCLEVAEHIPMGKQSDIFLENLNFLGKKGLVISWASAEKCGLGWGHVNCAGKPVREIIESQTDFIFDAEVTKELQKNSDISWIKSSVSFFRKKDFNPKFSINGRESIIIENIHNSDASGAYAGVDRSSAVDVDEDDDDVSVSLLNADNLSRGALSITDKENQNTRDAFKNYQERIKSIEEFYKGVESTDIDSSTKKKTKHQKDNERYLDMLLNAPILQLKYAKSSLSEGMGDGAYGPPIDAQLRLMDEKKPLPAGSYFIKPAIPTSPGQTIPGQQSNQGSGVGVNQGSVSQGSAASTLSPPTFASDISSIAPLGGGASAPLGGTLGGSVSSMPSSAPPQNFGVGSGLGDGSMSQQAGATPKFGGTIMSGGVSAKGRALQGGPRGEDRGPTWYGYKQGMDPRIDGLKFGDERTMENHQGGRQANPGIANAGGAQQSNPQQPGISSSVLSNVQAVLKNVGTTGNANAGQPSSLVVQQANMGGAFPRPGNGYRASLPENIQDSLQNTKASINKAIDELDKINRLHKSRRPTAEKESDLLNYEKVFASMEADYFRDCDNADLTKSLEETTDCIALHPEFGVHGNQMELQRRLEPI